MTLASKVVKRDLDKLIMINSIVLILETLCRYLNMNIVFTLVECVKYKLILHKQFLVSYFSLVYPILLL